MLVTILLLSFLVLVHEFGHFLAAKKFGVKVEEFGLGMPPKICKLFKWRGTEFTLNWLLLGGFVRMSGEDGPACNASKLACMAGREFWAQKIWKRAFILLAGVAANALFAVVAFSVVYAALGIPEEGNIVRIEAISKDSPAEKAGLAVGDVVEKIQETMSNEQKTMTSTDQFVEFISQHRGEEITLFMTRNNENLKILVAPRTEEETPEGEGALGVIVGSTTFTHYPWWQMPFRASWIGMQEAAAWGWNILTSFGGMIANLILAGKIPTDIAGPVGIASATKQAVSQGWTSTLQFAGILSINLAIMNALPIPALDGGRLLFVVIEKVRGKPVSPKKEHMVHLAGYIILIGLILLITAQDVLRLIAAK